MQSSYRSKGFLARLLVAAATGQDKDAFVEQEMRVLRCQWCAAGFPVTEDHHEVLGQGVPCDAAEKVS